VDGGGAGARIRGFRTPESPTGDLAFNVSGEHNGSLRDIRAIVSREGTIVRDSLVRNWLTGACRLAALPPGKGYQLEIRAAGWRTHVSVPFSIEADKETALAAVYLRREYAVPQDAITFPQFGGAVVRRAGESFPARFAAYGSDIRGVRLVRRIGPAVVSRACGFEEDKSAAFYYHRQGMVAIPSDTPPGTYDLAVSIAAGNGGIQELISPRAVCIVREFPGDPVFVSWGHLDTWGQYQAEYVSRLVELANLIAPDMVLISNEGNPAYAAGVLRGLEMPFVVNFGNHRGPDPGPWFGDPVGAVDFGSAFAVVNFGRAWDRGWADVDALLADRRASGVRILNGYEANAPPELLDRHTVALIHYGHGPGGTGKKVGITPTLLVGKSSSASFRVIRFRDGRPISYTAGTHASDAISFPRDGRAPIGVSFEPANDGNARRVTARYRNELEEDFPGARVVFVMPRGTYAARGGRIEEKWMSDDGKFTLMVVRFDLLRGSRGAITLHPETP
jgi:hypothetical protein